MNISSPHANKEVCREFPMHFGFNFYITQKTLNSFNISSYTSFLKL